MLMYLFVDSAEFYLYVNVLIYTARLVIHLLRKPTQLHYQLNLALI